MKCDYAANKTKCLHDAVEKWTWLVEQDPYCGNFGTKPDPPIVNYRCAIHTFEEYTKYLQGKFDLIKANQMIRVLRKTHIIEKYKEE